MIIVLGSFDRLKDSLEKYWLCLVYHYYTDSKSMDWNITFALFFYCLERIQQKKRVKF